MKLSGSDFLRNLIIIASCLHVHNLLQKTSNFEQCKETGDSPYIYQIEQDKACFQHDMAYGDFKYLTRRTASDKILRDKAFNIPKNPKYHGYQCGLASMAYKFSGSSIKNENISNK